MIKTIQEIIYEKLNHMDSSHTLIQYGEKSFSIGKIKKQVAQIYNYLLESAIKPGTSVGLIVKDREKMIAGIWSVLFARCVFVPFEYDMPSQTLSDMIYTAGISVILTDDVELTAEILNGTEKIVDINSVLECDTNPIFEFNPTLYSPTDSIYIYFTSGSTGLPKAILGQNKGLVHFIEWEMRKVGSWGDRVSQLTSPSHDPFLRDIFLPLIIEGVICIPESKKVILDGKTLLNWICKEKINIIHCTPSLLNHILASCNHSVEVNDLKYIFLAGEKVTPNLVNQCFNLLSGMYHLENLYGPTETTMAKLCYDITRDDRNRDIIPIGQPIDDTECYILDDHLKPCEQGEIYIRTLFMTLGYKDNEELNKAVFIRNPFDSTDETLMYKTGDMGRRMPDGNIEFLGRKDRQRKIRGNRIELSYIEEQIEKIDKVRKCVVLFNDEIPGHEYLAAYLISDTEYTGKQIKDFLMDSLPLYMVPSYVIFLSEFPMTNNMKVDENALPNPQICQNENINYNEVPEDEYERAVMEICSEVLNLPTVDLDESYISLGGNSLGVMTLISRLYEEFMVEMALEDILMSGSLRNMAEIVREKCTEYMEVYSEETSKQTYTLKEYLYDRDNDNHKYSGIVFGTKTVSNVIPFNEIFYRSCIYNAFISAIRHWGADELLFLSNDLILYGDAERGKRPEKTQYIEKSSLNRLFTEVGIEMEIIDSEDVIRDIVAVLDKDGMIILGVDCYFESIRKDFYLEQNWAHNILVYGYDGDSKEFLVLEQSGVNNLDYHEQRISFVDLEYSYFSNKQKFPNFEGGKNFVVLSYKGKAEKYDTKVYFQRYINLLSSNIGLVTKNIDNIPNICSYLLDHTVNMEEINKEYSNMLTMLDLIIESKYAQSYMFTRFGEIDDKVLFGRDIMNEIVKAWKMVRNILYRTKIIGYIRSDSLKNAIKDLNHVTELEHQLYDILSTSFKS